MKNGRVSWSGGRLLVVMGRMHWGYVRRIAGSESFFLLLVSTAEPHHQCATLAIPKQRGTSRAKDAHNSAAVLCNTLLPLLFYPEAHASTVGALAHLPLPFHFPVCAQFHDGEINTALI